MWRAFIDAMAEWNSVAICGRLALAILTGTVIGIDRGLKRRGAGIKKHALVCLGSALVLLTSEYMSMNLFVHLRIKKKSNLKLSFKLLFSPFSPAITLNITEFTSDHRSHCPLEELEECIPADLRRNVFCMHFTTDFTEKLKKKGFGYIQSNSGENGQCDLWSDVNSVVS